MSYWRSISDEQLLQATLLHRTRLGEGGCWIWIAGKDGRGYGLFNKTGKTRRAHRISYEAFVGPIPDELVIRHKCDNPSCINPDHLCVGTMKDNAQDREDRGRRAHFHGKIVGTSKLTEDQVIEIKRSKEKGVALSVKFGVASGTISSIRLGKSWRHLNQVVAN